MGESCHFSFDFLSFIKNDNAVSDFDFGFRAVDEGCFCLEVLGICGPDVEIFLGVDSFCEGYGFLVFVEKDLSVLGSAALVDGAGEIDFVFMGEMEKCAVELGSMECLVGGWLGVKGGAFFFAARDEWQENTEEDESSYHEENLHGLYVLEKPPSFNCLCGELFCF